MSLWVMSPSKASWFLFTNCHKKYKSLLLQKNDVGDHVTRFVQYERSRSPGAKECLSFRFMFCCCFYLSLRGLFTMAGGQQYRISVWPVWLCLCCVCALWLLFCFFLSDPIPIIVLPCLNITCRLSTHNLFMMRLCRKVLPSWRGFCSSRTYT